jgi:hypothetical protein
LALAALACLCPGERGSVEISSSARARGARVDRSANRGPRRVGQRSPTTRRAQRSFGCTGARSGGSVPLSHDRPHTRQPTSPVGVPRWYSRSLSGCSQGSSPALTH